MKRFLRLTALVLGLTLLSACGKEKAPEMVDASTQTVPTEGVTALELCSGEVTLRLDKDEDGQWSWRDDPDFPLEQEAVAALLALPAALDGGEAVADVQELSVYGLESPEKYVTVTSDGTDVTYYVGEQASDGRWYVLTPDGRVLYAAAEDAALLQRSIYDMAVLPALPAIAPEQLVSVTLNGTEGVTVTFSVDESGIRRSGSRDVTAATEALVGEIGALHLTGCVDYEPAEGAEAVCGLDVPAAALAVNYTADTGADKALTLLVGNGDGSGGRFVTLNGESTIYRMEEAALAEILRLAEAGL